MGTHLNCQMHTHNICLYKEVDKKHTDCYLRLWNCLTALIGVCMVINVNTVLILEQFDLGLHSLIRFVHSNV